MSRRFSRRILDAYTILLLLILPVIGGSSPAATSTPLAPDHAYAAQSQGGERYRDPIFGDAAVRIEEDVVYGRAIDAPSGDEVDLRLDVYELEDDPAPARAVFIFVHGGGFRAGDKSQGAQYAQELLPYGYVLISLNYRLNQGAREEGPMAAVADARQALRWLQSEAETRRFDTDRVFIGGTSAGAVTSLLLAYTKIGVNPDPGGEAGSEPVAVQGVVDWWGTMGNRVDDMSAGGPPLMIVHGTEDRTIPFAQAELIRARAEAVDIPYAWYPIEGGGHAAHDAQRDVPRLTDFFWEQVFDDGERPDVPTASPEPTEALPPTAEPTPTGTAPPGPNSIYLPATLRDAAIGTLPQPTPAGGASDPAKTGPFGFGVWETTIENHRARDGSAQPLPLVVWYPTDSSVSNGFEALEAPSRAGPFPLVVFSHGASSNPTQSSFLTEHLASHGFVVAAVQHPIAGSWQRRGEAFANRPGEVKAAVNFVVADSKRPDGRLRDAVDGTRLGVTGHSFGGLTTLALLGEEDNRFAVGMPMAPGIRPNDPADVSEDLPKIDVPLMFMMGQKDTLALYRNLSAAYKRIPVSTERYAFVFPAGTHFAYSDDCVLDCLDEDNLDHALGHQLVKTYGTAFMQVHLAGQTDYARYLEPSDDIAGGQARLVEGSLP